MIDRVRDWNGGLARGLVVDVGNGVVVVGGDGLAADLVDGRLRLRLLLRPGT